MQFDLSFRDTAEFTFNLHVDEFAESDTFAGVAKAPLLEVVGIQNGVATRGPGAMANREGDAGADAVAGNMGVVDGAHDTERVAFGEDVAFSDFRDPVESLRHRRRRSRRRNQS